MATTQAGDAAISAALDAIPEGGIPEEDGSGVPTPMSMADLLADVELPAPNEEAEKETKPVTEGKAKPEEAVETKPEEDAFDPKYAELGKAWLEEFQESPSRLTADLFRQMNADQQQEFIESITGEKGKTTQSSLPKGYRPQGELEEVLMPYVEDIKQLSGMKDGLAGLHQTVSSQMEMSNYAAAHIHLVEAKVDRVLEAIGLALTSPGLDKILEKSQTEKSFAKAVAKLTEEEWSKAVKAKTQAGRGRPLNSTGDASEIPVIKNGAKAVDILHALMGQQ